MDKVIVKCISSSSRLTLGNEYKTYSYNEPWKPLTEEEWLNMTQEDLLTVVADDGEKVNFAKWRFIRADVENVVEGAVFESTLGVLDDIIIDEKDILADVFSEKTELPKELVDHPAHYNRGKYEVIDVIEDWHLGFNLGNAIKYIGRCGHKDDPVQELEKAKWYVQREIDRIKKERE